MIIRRIDWFRVISDLRYAGLSQERIARILSVPRSRVRDWSNGSSPRYEDGRALLLLHRRAVLRRSKVVIPE